MSGPVDVLIVGAGPTGLVLASELRRRGVRLRLIDKRPGPGSTSRSFTLHAKTMEMFEHMGIAHQFLRDGIRSRGFSFNFKGKAERPLLDFTRVDSPFPYILVYNQDQTERRLREHLDCTYDCRPEWSTELTKLESSEGGYQASLTNGSTGTSEDVSAAWVVGCDGIHSFVRTAAGLDFAGANYDGMVMQMMDVAYDGFDGGDDWVHYFISKESFLLITRLPSGNHRVLISDMGAADDPKLTQRESFQRLIDGHVEGTRLREPDWATKWTIWKRIANAYHKGNLFLCGDAAHVHSPSGGQGMNAGMQDAFNLGWKLAMVVNGVARRSLLDTYDPERRPIGAQVIEGTDAMHDIIMAHGRGMEDRLKLTQAPGWHVETVSRIAGLSYNYREVTPVPVGLAVPQGIVPGDRAPDIQLSKTARLFDLLRHPRLTLLVISGSQTSDTEIREVRRAVDARFALAVTVQVVVREQSQNPAPAGEYVTDNDDLYSRYGSSAGGHAYLIRPDGYVALHCSLVDIDRALEFLEHWLVDRIQQQEPAMTEARRAAETPFAVVVESGRDYWWCACGQSKSQPFCDGSHRGSSFKPVKYSANANKTVYFCGCKATAGPPLCDGTHKTLP